MLQSEPILIDCQTVWAKWLLTKNRLFYTRLQPQEARCPTLNEDEGLNAPTNWSSTVLLLVRVLKNEKVTWICWQFPGVFLAAADESLVISTWSSIASQFNRLSEGSWLLVAYNFGYCVSLPVVSRPETIHFGIYLRNLVSMVHSVTRMDGSMSSSGLILCLLWGVWHGVVSKSYQLSYGLLRRYNPVVRVVHWSSWFWPEY